MSKHIAFNKKLIVFIILAVVVAAGLMIWYTQSSGDRSKGCHPDGMTLSGKCLPPGYCVGATDGVVKCEE